MSILVVDLILLGAAATVTVTLFDAAGSGNLPFAVAPTGLMVLVAAMFAHLAAIGRFSASTMVPAPVIGAVPLAVIGAALGAWLAPSVGVSVGLPMLGVLTAGAVVAIGAAIAARVADSRRRSHAASLRAFGRTAEACIVEAPRRDQVRLVMGAVTATFVDDQGITRSVRTHGVWDAEDRPRVGDVVPVHFTAAHASGADSHRPDRFDAVLDV